MKSDAREFNRYFNFDIIAFIS